MFYCLFIVVAVDLLLKGRQIFSVGLQNGYVCLHYLQNFDGKQYKSFLTCRYSVLFILRTIRRIEAASLKTPAPVSVHLQWENNIHLHPNNSSLCHWIKKNGSVAVWSTGHQPNLPPDPSSACTPKFTANPTGDRSTPPGPVYHQSQAWYGGTPPDTTAPQDLQLPRTCWEILLELRCSGSHSCADFSWSCDSPATVQTLTDATQVCRSTSSIILTSYTPDGCISYIVVYEK